MIVEMDADREDRLGVRLSGKLFLTSYAVNGHFYGAEIQAENVTHARQLAIARGLNEVVEGSVKDTWTGKIHGLLNDQAFVAAAHEACFMCFIGMSAGVLTPREVLGDEGLIHEIVHLAAGDPADLERRVNRCMEMAADFAHRIPGYPAKVYVAGDGE